MGKINLSAESHACFLLKGHRNNGVEGFNIYLSGYSSILSVRARYFWEFCSIKIYANEVSIFFSAGSYAFYGGMQ